MTIKIEWCVMLYGDSYGVVGCDGVYKWALKMLGGCEGEKVMSVSVWWGVCGGVVGKCMGCKNAECAVCRATMWMAAKWNKGREYAKLPGWWLRVNWQKNTEKEIK